MIIRTAAAALAVTCALTLTAVHAAEIRVVSSVGIKTALDALKPQFEKASGHTLVITYGTAVPLHRQIVAGTSFDVAILTPALVGDLAKSGKVATQANVAKAGIGVAVRSGAPKPDIGSADAFKRTMLSAKSITYSKEGQSGIVVARIFDRLGITEQMAPKTVYNTVSGMAAAGVVTGKAELALTLISEILPIEGADLVGPLPPDLQSYVVFTAGISPSAGDAGAAKALIDFLRSPAAPPVYKAKGLEPG
jgi:molybdate transport system substrate-binding protein